jgi:hypothetical protein
MKEKTALNYEQPNKPLYNIKNFNHIQNGLNEEIKIH